MDSNVSISVIIPAFNAQDTIIPCLNSVISQFYKFICEIIVVNDGSTDETEVVCLNYKEKNSHIDLKIFTQMNSGPSKARNLGVRMSTGSWIAFLDADDIWLPNKLQNQFKVLNENPNCKLIGSLFYEEKLIYTGLLKEIKFLSMLFKNQILTSTVVVKKEVVMKYFFDENKKYAEDCKLWFQIVYEYQALIIFDGLVKYSQVPTNHAPSLSSNMLKMELGELDNFKFLLNQKMINYYLYLLVVSFSILKYLKRLLEYNFKKLRIIVNLLK